MTSHCRFAPRRHAFRYRMFWFAIDLDELPLLDKTIRFFRHNHAALVSIHDRDYGGKSDGDIQQRIRKHLEDVGIDEPVERIELITIPRVAGYVFNPVSFFLCISATGQIRNLVAEVRNTFGEIHHYVGTLEPSDSGDPDLLECRIPKEFYVSPFFRVNGEYHIRIKSTENRLRISVDLHDDTGHVFSASMDGESREMTSRNLLQTICRMPFFALTIMTKIHWQAIRLYFARGLRMFEKPTPTHPSTTPSSNPQWWMRLRTACVQKAVRSRSSVSLNPEVGIPTEKSE